MTSEPNVKVNGETKHLRSDEDVLDVFEQHAGFGVGVLHSEDVGGLTVESIDAELDYHKKHGYTLRCYVYFEEDNEEVKEHVHDDPVFDVDGWDKDAGSIGVSGYGIIYENILDQYK